MLCVVALAAGTNASEHLCDKDEPLWAKNNPHIASVTYLT